MVTNNTFEVKSIAVYIPITQQQADDYDSIKFNVERMIQAGLYGHHSLGNECCCIRMFKTLRGAKQHARYQNKKHQPVFEGEPCPIKI